jgi:hypothetical protein
MMATIAGKAIGHLDLKDTGGEEKVVEMVPHPGTGSST